MFYVYMLASKPYGTLYVGVTSDLARRVWEHKNKLRVQQAIRCRQAGLVRDPRLRRSGNPARGADKGVEARLENKLSERDNPRWIDLYQSISR
jgi:putative endonuclease